MSKLIAAPAAQGNVATLFVGFELSKSTWLIGLYAPELGSTISRHKIDGGNLEKAIALIEAARKRLAGRGKPVRLRVAPQTGTALLRELQGRRVVREVTGRGSFRAFAI